MLLPSKHVTLVLRRCLACRQLRARNTMIRIMHNRLGNGILMSLPDDGTSDTKQDTKQMGRSVYLCDTPDCLGAGLKGKRLAKALKVAIPDDILRTLTHRAMPS